MPTLWQTLRGRASSSDEKRYTFSEWMNDQLMFQGGSYPLVGASTYGTKAEVVENSFAGYTQAAYKHNGIVFAIVLSRMLLFTEARFQWQRLSNGRPTDLFGSQDLAVLETPWPNGTTGELLARMEQDVSLAGNFFAVREADRIRRLRPDWVQIVLSAPPEVSARSDVVGYRYVPGGVASGEGEIFLPEQVCHWSPIPDPIAQYRGMSWITPVMREIQADGAATEHKAHFFDNAATPNLAVSMKDPMTPAQFREFVDAMDDAHRGAHNAYKTLYTGGGADVSVIGADMRQLDFRQTQGAGETRVCAAGGVPPIIVGLSEGLKAGTYSNYGMARRKFGDHWARPQWRSACAALSSLVKLPGGSTSGAVRLWYDDRDIAFLREDEGDRAGILKEHMLTIESAVRAGFEPESAKAAVVAGDLSGMTHTGLYSVQLQPPLDNSPPAIDAGAPAQDQNNPEAP